MIARKGEDTDINRKASGALDGYGDAAATWAKQATEKMMIAPLASLKSLTEVSIAGRFKDVEQVAYAKSDSVVLDNDQLQRGSSKWIVLHVEEFRIKGAVRMKVCFLEVYN